MSENQKATVMIADASGHTTLELTRAEFEQDVVEQNPNAWVFVGDQLVQPAELNDVQWGADTIRVMPQMVGGF